MTERLHPNCKDGIIAYRHYRNLGLYHCYKFNNINTLPSCSSSFHCQNSLGTYRVIKNNLKYLLCVSYGIIEGLTRISRVFSLQKTIRISPIQRHHYITSSYTYLFFKVFLFLIAVSLWTGRFSKTYPSFLTLKEGSTILTKPLFPQEREDVTALRCSEPLRFMVGGASKPSPDCTGWDRLGITCYKLGRTG